MRSRVVQFAVGIAAAFLILVTLVWLIEPVDPDGSVGNSFGDALWFGLVTMTTVGYGDISPTTFGGKAVTVLLFFLSIFVFSFLITRIETVVAERQRLRALGMNGTNFTGHVVVCSGSQIAKVAIKELLAAGRQVAVVVEDAGQIPLVQVLGHPSKLFVTVGDPTAEETLKRTNIAQAGTVVAAAEDDTLNLIVALEIKVLAPNARIVVSTKRAELRNTLTASGVTYVA
ncbi:MAG: potassium channel family protein, partial [Myxococcales bacterium]|nr:potassium channel family protein [Myxococcales bacterium]